MNGMTEVPFSPSQLPALAKTTTLKFEVQRIAAKHRQNKRPGAAAKVDTLNVYFGEEYINLLMQWVQAVCTFYGLRVQNFTTCFADGRALCYMVGPSLFVLYQTLDSLCNWCVL
jgi:hypothetical protein